MCIKSPKCQTISPFLLVKIKQHLLLKFIFPVIDGYGIIMSVQPMDQSLKSGNKDMSELVKEVQNKCFPNVNNNNNTKKGFSEDLNGWFIQMPQIGCCLPWFLPKHHCLWIDQSKSINHHFAFNTLNWINNYSHCSLIQSLKTLQETIAIYFYIN